MAPGGGGPCKELAEAQPCSSDNMAAATKRKSERSSALVKYAGGVVGDDKMDRPLINGVHELLECPVCRNSMLPPIFQCSSGHTLCAGCNGAHDNCPTCLSKLGDIRCLALEKVAESLDLTCRYQSAGCHDIVPYYRKLKHEKRCRFRPYKCPYAGSECSVTGDIPALVKHLREDHKVDMHDGCTFNHRYVKSDPQEVKNATWMLTVFNCHGSQFCLHFEAFPLGTTPVYMAFLRFMGEDREAKLYSYSLEVGGHGRKMTWQGVPRSIRDSHRRFGIGKMDSLFQDTWHFSSPAPAVIAKSLS